MNRELVPMFPSPRLVRCAECGETVDALRARAARMTSSGPLYYCSMEHAEDHRLAELLRQPEPPLTPLPGGRQSREVGTSGPAVSSAQEQETDATSPASDEVTAHPRAPGHEEASPPIEAARPAVSDPTRKSTPEIAPSPTGGSTKAAARSPARPPSKIWGGEVLAWQVAPAALSALACVGIWMSEPDRLGGALVLFFTVAAWGLLSGQVASRLGRPTLRRRDLLAERLRGNARRVDQNGETLVSPAQLRAGEELHLHPGDVLLADAVLVSGAARVRLVFESDLVVEASEGDRLPAGAEVQSGDARVVCAQTGAEATFFRLASGQQEEDSLLVSSARQTYRRLAPAGLLISFALSLFWTRSMIDATQVAIANFAALASPFPYVLLKQVHRKWLLALATRGVSLARSAVDRAAHTTQCVFCTRGTVLSGEPEVAEIHALRGASEEEVLSLAAGAESVVEHPAASSILRAAHARGIGPDRSRGHDVVSGMGVLCFSSHGDPLVVGSRDLLLRQRVSIAVAEELLRKLESRGRMGILVAKGERLIGVLALHDAIRAGAKAAVQLLIDGQVEPVLLSGDTRSTAEALGRALSVEHVRPEVPARDRGTVIKELALGGNTVAVVGHSPLDDSALSGANTPVVLDAAALPQRTGGIAVLNSDVQLAVESLLSIQRLRREALVTWSLSALPIVLGVLSATSLLFPPVVAPILAALGGIFSAVWVLSRRQDCSPSPRYGTPRL